jgi:hypothetical protein
MGREKEVLRGGERRSEERKRKDIVGDMGIL